MTDSEKTNAETEYYPPSVKRWGTVLDLTAGGVTGCSGDTFEDDPHSVFSSGQGDPACGNSGNGNGS